MPRCEFCNKWMFDRASPLIVYQLLCKKCWREWHYKCRDFVLNQSSLKEYVRLCGIQIATTYEPDQRGKELSNLEGDLVLLDNAVCYLVYSIQEIRDRAGEIEDALKGGILGIAGTLLNTLKDQGKADSDTLKDLTPAQKEVVYRSDRYENGQDPHCISVDIRTALQTFPYVSVIKREHIRDIRFQKGLE